VRNRRVSFARLGSDVLSSASWFPDYGFSWTNGFGDGFSEAGASFGGCLREKMFSLCVCDCPECGGWLGGCGDGAFHGGLGSGAEADCTLAVLEKSFLAGLQVW
jgi:hypothetical protein